MGIRSFLAFELPAELKTVVARASQDLKATAIKARWVKVDNIHLTVVFLGSVAPEQLEPVQACAGSVCQGHRPFDIMIRGMGIFGSKRHPRVLWLGLGGDIDRMAVFRDDLQNALQPFGLKPERRPFRPHLTLGRFRKGPGSEQDLNTMLKKHETLTSRRCPLTELVLIKSDLKPSGPIYTEMARWPLGTGA